MRKFSVVALVTGIISLVISPIGPMYTLFMWRIFKLTYSWLLADILSAVIIIIPVLIFGGVAIVLGSIDLKRIKSGLYHKKGRGFDITGITSGIIFFLFYIPIAFFIVIEAMLFKF